MCEQLRYTFNAEVLHFKDNIVLNSLVSWNFCAD